MRIIQLVYFFLFIIAGSNAQQYNIDFYQEDNTPSVKNTQFVLAWDNDLLCKTDYYFTNGVSIQIYSDNLKSEPLTRFLKSPLHTSNLYYGLSIRQNMYTPKEMFNPEIVYSDRPYAGYLTAEYKLISESEKYRVTSSLTLGVLGSYSLAGKTQDLVHSMDHLEQALGWQYQISDAPIINISYTYQQKILAASVIDLSYILNGRLGSLYTDASINLRGRIGKINNSFSYLGTKKGSDKFQYYLYFDFGSRLSYFDATLQGSIMVYNPSQHYFNNDQRHMFISKWESGFVFTYSSFSLNANITRITPEFKGGLSHGWVTIALGYTF